MKFTEIYKVLKRQHVLVAAIIFLVSTLLFFSSFLSRISTDILGVIGDNGQYFWSMWWVKKNIFISIKSIFYTNMIYFPEGNIIAIHPFSFYNQFINILLEPLFTQIEMYNFFFLKAYFLGAIGAYILTYYWTKSFWISLVAGLIFGFNPLRFAHRDHYNIVSYELLPFFILFYLKYIRENKLKHLILAAVFFTFNALAAWYHMIYAITFCLGYCAYKIKDPSIKKIVLNTMKVLSLGMLPLMPLISVMAYEAEKAGKTIHKILFPVDISHFFVVFPEHILAKVMNVNAFYKERFQKIGSNLNEGVFYLGYISMGFAAISILKCKKVIKKYFIALTLILILSMGVVLFINGVNTHIPLPSVILQELPLFSRARAASRWFILGYLFWGVIVGVGVVTFLKSLKKEDQKQSWKVPLAGIIIYSLLFIDYYPTHIPSIKIQTNLPVFKILPDKGDYGILNLPVLPHLYMIHQTYHEKPIVSGYIATELKSNLLTHRVLGRTWSINVKVPLQTLKEELIKSKVKFIIYHKLPLYSKVTPEFIKVYSTVFDKVYEDRINALFKVY